MNGKQLREMGEKLTSMYGLLDKLDRSVERIEIVTVVREPNTSLSADAYNGLRKQVIAAVSERTSHLHQLTQFDGALRANATPDELASLVREWLGQASVGVIEDPALPDGFTIVGPEDATAVRVVRPAYVDEVTGRVIRAGVAERFQPEPEPEPHDEQPEAEAAPVTPADDDESDEQEPSPEDEAPAAESPSAPGGDK